MFRPYAAHITQRSLEGQATEAVLQLAQTFTEADMQAAEPHTPRDIVRPEKLQAVLEQCAPPTASVVRHGGACYAHGCVLVFLPRFHSSGCMGPA